MHNIKKTGVMVVCLCCNKRSHICCFSKLEQPSCLKVRVGYRLKSLNAPAHGDHNATTPNPKASCTLDLWSIKWESVIRFQEVQSSKKSCTRFQRFYGKISSKKNYMIFGIIGSWDALCLEMSGNFYKFIKAIQGF